MDFDVESLKKLRELTVKNVKELAKKNDLNPAETKAMLDGFKAIERIDEHMQKCKMEENGMSQYSGHGEMEMYATPRRYNITSYGDPNGYAYYDNSMAMNNSMARRRSYANPMGHNQYMGQPYYGDMRGYSGHSFKDRIIACLEHEFDTTNSEYETQQLHRFIDMIRSAE